LLDQADVIDATSPRFAANTASRTASLLPLALWAAAAAVALFLVVLAGRSDFGAQRAVMFASMLHNSSPQPPLPQQAAAAPFDAESATRQLAQAVRGLAEDRDRLTTRIADLERRLDDVTGSISRQAEAAKAAETAGAEAAAPPRAAASPPTPWPEAPPADATATTAAIAPATSAAISWPPDAAVSVDALAGYGADLGSALSLKSLRAVWTGLRSAHPQLFQGLHAGVTVKDNPRSNRAELRLVVGPFSNQVAAVQLCAALIALRHLCQPAMFDGRLALQ